MTTTRDEYYAVIDKLLREYYPVLEISIPTEMCTARGGKVGVTFAQVRLQTVYIDLADLEANSYLLAKDYHWEGEGSQDWYMFRPTDWETDHSVCCPKCGSGETDCLTGDRAQCERNVHRCRECGTWFQEREPDDLVIMEKDTKTDAVHWEYATVRVPIPGQNSGAPDPTELWSDETGDGATGFEPVARMGTDGWELVSTCPIVGTTPAGAVETRSLVFVFKRRRHG